MVYFSGFVNVDIMSPYNFAGCSHDDFFELQIDNPDKYDKINEKYTSFITMLNLIMK